MCLNIHIYKSGTTFNAKLRPLTTISRSVDASWVGAHWFWVQSAGTSLLSYVTCIVHRFGPRARTENIAVVICLSSLGCPDSGSRWLRLMPCCSATAEVLMKMAQLSAQIASVYPVCIPWIRTFAHPRAANCMFLN